MPPKVAQFEKLRRYDSSEGGGSIKYSQSFRRSEGSGIGGSIKYSQFEKNRRNDGSERGSRKVAQFEKYRRYNDSEGGDTDYEKHPSSFGSGSVTRLGSKPIRLSSFNEVLDSEMEKMIEYRNNIQIFELEGNERVDVTPKNINVAFDTEAFKRLRVKARTIIAPSDFHIGSYGSLSKTRSSRVAVRLSMEDIILGVGSERMVAEDLKITKPLSPYVEGSSSSSSGYSVIISDHHLPLIKVVLRKTNVIPLFQQQSTTAIKYTEDGNFAEYDNKQYDYLTIGRGKVRRRSEAETQTLIRLYKSRKINTIRKNTTERGSYVSYYEMYDTYKLLKEMAEEAVYGSTGKPIKPVPVLSRRGTPEQQIAHLVATPQFQWASTVIKRLLAGNNFEMSLRRYRYMLPADRTAPQVAYKYNLEELFCIEPVFAKHERKAVSDLSFCYSNNDILAVGYGIYSYHSAKVPHKGEVCIWSVKNTTDPERYYYYNYPVVALEFSPYMPNMLAIGLFDGSVEVRDITYFNAPAIAVSQRCTSPGVEPVLAIKWIKLPDSNDNLELDPFIALFQDGSVTRYSVINSPFLLGVKQMQLERIEGNPEGLQVPTRLSTNLLQHSNPHPQGLNLTKHPVLDDIYYILTDEGCVHKCSTNYQQHYLEVLKTHDGAVNAMDFSPWSPKLFLTCGNDWRIRIWIVGMFQPLVTLQNRYGPYQWASWSRTHATIIVAITRKEIEIWDLKRSILKPVSTHSLSSSYNTLALFSRDGNSIACGNERGKLSICTFMDMPFPPHFQYDALEKAIFSAVANYPEVMNEFKSLGYFGYPNKQFVMPP